MQRKDGTFCLSQRNFTIALTCVTLLLLFIADLISRWNINQIFTNLFTKLCPKQNTGSGERAV